MENESHDELSVENLEIHFRRFRDNTKEYTMSKLVKLLMGKDFVNGLGYNDDKLDVFYASFIINVIENFVSSENDKELLLALNGFLEGYDTMLVGKRYEAYMNYAPPLNNKIKRYWTDPNKQFHNLEKPIEKTLANRLYGDITRDNRKKLKAIAKQVIKELNESPGGFPKSPKLRTIRELPQIQDNNTEENPPAPDENPPVTDENPPATSEKDKEDAKKAYILAATAVIVVLAGLAIFFATMAQLNKNAALDESSDSMNQSMNINPNDEDIFNSALGTSEKTDSGEESGSEETSASTNIPNLEIEIPEGLSQEINGDGRAPYTTYQIKHGILGNKIVFNSISDSSSIDGDERNFVGACDYETAKAGQVNTWNNNTQAVENGKEYIIRLYVHNNNPGAETAVATGTKVAFSIPTRSSKSIRVDGFIKSDNADPGEYWDYVDFTSNNAFHLEYVYGSAVLENGGFAEGGVALSDEIVTKASQGGVLIGYNALDGRIPGGFDYTGYITIRVKAVYDTDYTIDNKVRVIGGDKTWSNSVNAKIGDIVEFQIAYKNTSENGEIQTVGIKDILPKSLKYVPETTKLWNATSPEGVLLPPDGAIFADGTWIGDSYIASNDDKQNAYVRFRAEVVEDGLACGVNTLTNWAQGGVGDITIQDHASVIVNKPYDTPELPDTDTETIDSDVN